MIFGFCLGGDEQKGLRRASAAGVDLCRTHDHSTAETVQAIEDLVIYGATRTPPVKVLLQYNDDISSDMPIGNLVAQIARVGPAGTVWNTGQPGAGLSAYAPTHIEVGNEYSFSYRGDPATNAVGVANTVQRFYNAVGPTLGANAMKFICEADDGDSGTDAFINSLISTVPTIRTMLDGWTIHDYGPTSNEAGHTGSPGSTYHKLAVMVTRLNNKGYTTDKIWITENGISTKDSVALTNNYGWDVAKSYVQAGTDLLAIVRLHGNSLSFSSRIAFFSQFQAYDAGTAGNDREDFFGAYKNDETVKLGFTSAAITLAAEFPAVAAPPTTTPTPGGAVAGGNAPAEPGGASGIITFVSQAGTSFLPGADPWVVQGPGSGLAGDLVLIGLVQGTQSTTVVSAPAGFTQDGTATEGGDGRLRLFYGYFSVVGAGPYSFDMSGSITGEAVCAYYRGVHTTTPLNATSLYNATTSSTAWAGSQITPANTGAMIVTIASCSPGAAGRTTTATAPAVKRGGAENGDGLYVLADKLLTTIAATTIAGTISVAESMAIGTIALRAAPVTAPTTETPTPGGAIADGRAPTVPEAMVRGAADAQGIGTVVPLYPSSTTYPSNTTYPTPFTAGLNARAAVPAGGAIAAGTAPGAAPAIPGGAISNGRPPAPRVTVAGGGAVSAGNAPVAFIRGDAVAAGASPTARVAATRGDALASGSPPAPRAVTLPGGAIALGSGPVPGSTPVRGGAIADGRAPVETFSTTPARGGATAAGAALIASTLLARGGFIADGFSTPVGPTHSAGVTAGGALAGGNAPGRADLATPGGAVAGGTATTARAQATAGGAAAAGFSLSDSVLPPITTIGGGEALGTAPSVRSAVAAGGAIAAGTAPTSQTTATPTPGGAEVGATVPTARVAAATGGADGAGNATGSRTPIAAGGALADGIAQASADTNATPVPGGADAAGTGPYAWTTTAVGGAIAATNTLTGATVLITTGGSLAGGHIPGAPVTISRHFDDDDGPVLAGAFDSGTQRGQT